MVSQRTIFFVSDRTGITAETLGQSLLTQFEGVRFRQVAEPYVDSVDKAHALAEQIDATATAEGAKPIVFSTLIAETTREIVQTSNCLFVDFFDAFIAPLERELGTKSSQTAGRAHGTADSARYHMRIEAMNFALATDDGARTYNYDQADVVLIGVSRSGKTPTCLYLALHYGLCAANYPLTEEVLSEGQLPDALREHRGKLFGLTIQAERLQQIRSERRPDSRYASRQQIRRELSQAEGLFRRLGSPFIDTTHSSIEEISTHIIHEGGLERRFF